MLLLIVTYDITFDGTTSGSSHQRGTILYACLLQCSFTPRSVRRDDKGCGLKLMHAYVTTALVDALYHVSPAKVA